MSLIAPQSEFVKLVVKDHVDKLVVFFGSRRAKNFEYAALFADDNVHQLHLREAEKARWFLDGVPGFADDISGIAQSVLRVAEALSVSKITMVGSSMGGYAAIVAGSIFGADKVVAFSPQLELNEKWEFSPEDTVGSSGIDTRSLIASSPETKFHIVTSTEIIDVYHAALVHDLANVEVSLLRSPHNVLGHAKRGRGVKCFLDEAVFGGIENEVFDGRLSVGSEMRRFLDAFYKKNYAIALDCIKTIQSAVSEWPEACLLEGHCQFWLRNFAGAIEPYELAREKIFHLNPAYYVQLIVCYEKIADRRSAMNTFSEYLGRIDELKHGRGPYLSRLRTYLLSVQATEFAELLVEYS